MRPENTLCDRGQGLQWFSLSFSPTQGSLCRQFRGKFDKGDTWRFTVSRRSAGRNPNGSSTTYSGITAGVYLPLLRSISALRLTLQQQKDLHCYITVGSFTVTSSSTGASVLTKHYFSLPFLSEHVIKYCLSIVSWYTFLGGEVGKNILSLL